MGHTLIQMAKHMVFLELLLLGLHVLKLLVDRKILLHSFLIMVEWAKFASGIAFES